jgi:1-phosphofructokinase
MKIATITLNPAIDQTVRADHFRPDTVNYGQSIRFDAGGKGVNVASFLADYGLSPIVTGLLGRDNSSIFEQFFASKHIEDRFVRIPGETRTGIKIVDEANQQTTDINMPGPLVTSEAMDELFQVVEQLASSCDWFVLSGSLSQSIPTMTYASLITLLKEHGKQILLDTSREALRVGVAAVPTVVKPNSDELRQLTGRALVDDNEIEEAARQLLDTGVQLVVVSLGKRGALFVDPTETLLAVPPPVVVKSTVGAGDAMVAGLLVGRIQELKLADCARLATAFSLGAITNVGHTLPSADTLQAYVQQVTIHHWTAQPYVSS